MASTLAKWSPTGRREPSTVMVKVRPLLTRRKNSGMVTQLGA